MFGTLRLVLALMVAFSHLAGLYTIHGTQTFQFIGLFAVYGFYVVSGYLMTFVLNQTYHFHAREFWLNRLIRIYPGYYLVCGLSLIGILLWPTEAAAYHFAFKVSHQALDYFGLAAIFPYAFYNSSFRLVPPTWSVGVELVMYFTLFAFVARGPRRAAFALVPALYYVFTAEYNFDRYASLWGALLPFTFGALLYFHRDRLRVSPPKLIPGLVLVSALVILNIGLVAAGSSFWPGFYINLGLLTLLIAGLAQVASPHPVRRQVDKRLGDLAYPIFLLHWTVGFFVSVLMATPRENGLRLFVYSLPTILLLAALLAWGVDRPLEKWRARLKASPALKPRP